MRTDCAGDGRGVSKGGQGPQVVFHCFLDLQEEGSGVGNEARPEPGFSAIPAAAPQRI